MTRRQPTCSLLLFLCANELDGVVAYELDATAACMIDANRLEEKGCLFVRSEPEANPGRARDGVCGEVSLNASAWGPPFFGGLTFGES